jgi:GMP synthase PP-ATPase subunit
MPTHGILMLVEPVREFFKDEVRRIVTGDGRRHDPVIALRAVETIDLMTAHWAHLPYELLDVRSRRIVNEFKGASRVFCRIRTATAVRRGRPASRRSGP